MLTAVPQRTTEGGIINLTDCDAASAPAWPEDTKTALTEAGLALLAEALEAGELDVFRLLSPSAIGKRARRNKALLYHHWPSEDERDRLKEYRKELYRHALVHFHQSAGAALQPPVPGETLETASERITAALFQRLIADRAAFAAYRLSIAVLWAAPQTGTQGDTAQLATFVRFSEIARATLGLELVEPWTDAELVLMLGAIFNGLVLSLPASQQLFVAREDGTPSAVTQTVVAAVRAATRPVSSL